MNLTEPTIQTYAEAHTQTEPPLLAHIRQETPATQMLSSHLQGRALAAISHMLRPKRILEIGTYTGYSALCLAEGLQPDGLLHTIDKNADLAPITQKYFAAAGKAHQIKHHTGQAADILPTLTDTTFDLVFIDADKSNYTQYYHLIIHHVRPSGFIIADNVLWKGKVAHKPITDKRAQAMIDFNTQVHHDPRVENVLLPIRDGLMVLRKK